MQLANMVYTIAFVSPVLEDLVNKQLREQNPQAQLTVPGWALNLGVILVSLLGMVFATILLIFALRPAMGQQLAMAGQPGGDLGRQDAQDYYDEDYQRQRHEPPPEM
jgi:hypothetical protein